MKSNVVISKETRGIRASVADRMISPRANLAYSTLEVKQKVWAILKRFFVKISASAPKQPSKHRRFQAGGPPVPIAITLEGARSKLRLGGGVERATHHRQTTLNEGSLHPCPGTEAGVKPLFRNIFQISPLLSRFPPDTSIKSMIPIDSGRRGTSVNNQFTPRPGRRTRTPVLHHPRCH
jgi:hypothetical protein